MSLARETLHCDPKIEEVIDAMTGLPLPRIEPGQFALHGKGRLLLRVPNYFDSTD